MQKLEFTAADLSKTEGKSFVQYLVHWMPVLDKLSSKELVKLFEDAKDLVSLRDSLLKTDQAEQLVKTIKDLIKDYKYPPNTDIEKLIKKWENKKIEDKDLIKELHSEIKKDLGMGVSKEYLSKALYHIYGGDDPEKSFANDKKKLMKYITNIILKGADLGVVSYNETLEKVAICLRNDEMLLKSIISKES